MDTEYMEKYRIQIVKLGSQRHDYVFTKIDKFSKSRSTLFEVEIFEKADLPDTDMGWAFSTDKIEEILVPCFDSEKFDMSIGYIDNQLHGKTYGNIYGSNIKDNKIFVVSFFQVAEFLAAENIDLTNFILVNIYRYLTRFVMKDRIVHNETRSCTIHQKSISSISVSC